VNVDRSLTADDVPDRPGALASTVPPCLRLRPHWRRPGWETGLTIGCG